MGIVSIRSIVSFDESVGFEAGELVGDNGGELLAVYANGTGNVSSIKAGVASRQDLAPEARRRSQVWRRPSQLWTSHAASPIVPVPEGPGIDSYATGGDFLRLASADFTWPGLSPGFVLDLLKELELQGVSMAFMGGYTSREPEEIAREPERWGERVAGEADERG